MLLKHKATHISVACIAFFGAYAASVSLVSADPFVVVLQGTVVPAPPEPPR